MHRRTIKRVRFADETTADSQYRVSHTRTPRTIYTIYSSPSLSQEHVKFYRKGCECIQLHRYLEISAVTWNLLEPPTTITRNHRLISSSTLYEPATSPPLTFLVIISPYLPWTIKVHASSPNSPCVTLYDVFHAVYHSLQTNITRSEFKSLPTQTDQERAVHAYKSRYRRHYSTRTYEAERRGGMKRVDFLMRHFRFLGLSNSCCQAEEWKLNVTS